MGNCFGLWQEKRDIRLRNKQQHVLSITRTLCETLESHVKGAEVAAQQHLECAKHARRPPGANREMAVQYMLKFKAKKRLAFTLRAKLTNATIMLETVQGADLTRQIIQSTEVTRKYIIEAAIDPERATQAMDGLAETHEDTQEIHSILGGPLGGPLDEDDEILRALDAELALDAYDPSEGETSVYHNHNTGKVQTPVVRTADADVFKNETSRPGMHRPTVERSHLPTELSGPEDEQSLLTSTSSDVYQTPLPLLHG
jgi:hypothetical protein